MLYALEAHPEIMIQRTTQYRKASLQVYRAILEAHPK
jgi:hypothetical protein